MKKNIHPDNYRHVLFVDINNDFKILTRSTIQLGNNPETMTWTDGKEYPLAKMQISSSSHNFYTNKRDNIEKVSVIAKFKAKYNRNK